MAVVFNYLPEDVLQLGPMFFVACGVILVLSALDYVTGLIGGTMNEGFDSSKMRIGLVHKFTYIVAIILCVLVEIIFNIVGVDSAVAQGITTITLIWIAVTETGSIMENLVKINPELTDAPFMRIFDKREVPVIKVHDIDEEVLDA